MSRVKLLRRGRSTTPAPAATTYDASVGLGVTNGFADLTKHASAKYIFVGSGGNDGNTGLSHAQRLLTMSAAMGKVTRLMGDQVLVAEGTTLTAALPDFVYTGGLSAAYPTVIQSYDPADPTNTAKYGKATTARPVFSYAGIHAPLFRGDNDIYYAMRGLNFNPGNVSGNGISIVGPHAYWLVENCVFSYTGIAFNHSAAPAQPGLILRRNSFYGNWDSSSGNHSQGAFLANASGHTVEDCIFWHCGWKIGGAGRDSSTDGTTVFRHSVYSPVDTDALIRRNIFMDPAATGISARGNVNAYENLLVDCPLGLLAMTEPENMSYRPTGIDIDIHHNGFIGQAGINTTNPRGRCIGTANGKSTASIHHNVIAESGNMSGSNVQAFYNQVHGSTSPNMSSYATYDNNLIEDWDNSNNYTGEDTASTGRLFSTFTNNIWDAATSGTNTNNAGQVYPNAYVNADALAVALGYADRTAWITAAVARPDLDWTPTARATLFAGYGR